MSLKYDVFLSHNSIDKPRVRLLAGRLRAAGLKVWFDEDSLKLGDDVYLSIEKGIDASKTLILCISQAALDSGWVSLERSAALFRDPANTERRFLPLLLEDCDMPATLRRYKYADWRVESDKVFAQILAACKPEPEETPPHPPQHTPSEPAQVLAELLGYDTLSLGHTGGINAVAFSPDGKQALSGSDDKTVRLWDLSSRKAIATMEGHNESVWSVAFSPDGKQALSGSLDTTVRLWDLSSRKAIATMEGHNESVLSVAFSPDGKAAWSGAIHGVARRWPLASETVDAAKLDEAQRLYSNAKVVLVGESGVGKSGLAHRLIEDEFIETSSTHGMQVWRLELGVESEERGVELEVEREVLLWDLAGQEDYRLIHQLFLDETAVALVLINPQRTDPFSEAAEWVKALQAAVGRHSQRPVVKLLIAARLDRGALKVSDKKIQQFMEDQEIAAFLETSAMQGTNCSDEASGGPSPLKQLISENILWEHLTTTTTPKLLGDIKNALMKMNEEEDVSLLRFSELEQRLQNELTDHNFDIADIQTAATLLGNHGVVMPLPFGNIVLLRPALMNSYASAVVRAARTHVDEIGCVNEQDIYSENFNWEGIDRLPRPDEQLMLHAMVEMLLDRSLCIAENTPRGRELIFPSQYRRDRPIPTYPSIFVSYTFTGELQTIYTTLVVRLWYSREFNNRELWKNAAEFTTSKGKIAGFLMEITGEGEGTISIFFENKVPDELKVILIDYVRQHLEQYAQEIRRDRRYVCDSCGTAIKNLDAVQQRLEAGKNFIYCQICDEKVALIDHIEQHLKESIVAEKVAEMDATAGRELGLRSLEQIFIGHMMATCGESSQHFRPSPRPGMSVDGELEFIDNDGHPSGKKIYLHFNMQLRKHERHDREVHDHFKLDEKLVISWIQSSKDVWIVYKDDEGTIRWLSAQAFLDYFESSKDLALTGTPITAAEIWRLRDNYIPRKGIPSDR